MWNLENRFYFIYIFFIIISDPRRGCYMGLSMFISFFFLFFSFFFFFSVVILSGPYLWNRYSQRLQIECAAWSCGLVVHCCLPSNSLRYFVVFFHFVFFLQDFVRVISLEPLLTETPNWECCLVLRSRLCTVAYHPIRFVIFFFFFFFSATILSGPYLWNHYSQRLQIECAAWSCGLILHCCLPSNSLCYIFFFFSFFFRHDFVRAISLEPLLAVTPNWVCCLVLRSNFALLLTIQFTLFFFFRHDFFFFRRDFFFLFFAEIYFLFFSPRFFFFPRFFFYLFIYFFFLPIIFFLAEFFFFFGRDFFFFFFCRDFFFSFFLPRFWPGHISGTVTPRLQIECAAWSCSLIVHCCLPSNSLRYFLFFYFFFILPRFCSGHISRTVTRRDSKLSVLLGPAV